MLMGRMEGTRAGLVTFRHTIIKVEEVKATTGTPAEVDTLGLITGLRRPFSRGKTLPDLGVIYREFWV